MVPSTTKIREYKGYNAQCDLKQETDDFFPHRYVYLSSERWKLGDQKMNTHVDYC